MGLIIKRVTRPMIKYALISRYSDGTVFCEMNEGGFSEPFEALKMNIKKYHREVTIGIDPQSPSLHQIEDPNYCIYYRINSFVVFTVVTELGYPAKLSNAFLDAVSSAFFNEAKCVLGSTNLNSRLEAIEGSHYFVRFDRVVKQKKKEFDDPSSMKNADRLKKQLQSIHDIMKENMGMLDKRHNDLLATQQKAHRINEQSKKFEQTSKKVVWHLWVRKNLIWLVLILLVVLIYFCL